MTFEIKVIHNSLHFYSRRNIFRIYETKSATNKIIAKFIGNVKFKSIDSTLSVNC